MSKILSGNWEGKFTYGDNYETGIAGKTVAFVMDLEFEEVHIKGSCTDEETKNLFNEPATIEGLYDNNFVNIAKTYPCLVTTAESGELIADRNSPPVSVHYTGRIQGKNTFAKLRIEGDWDLRWKVTEPDGRISFYSGRGTWWMTKND